MKISFRLMSELPKHDEPDYLFHIYLSRPQVLAIVKVQAEIVLKVCVNCSNSLYPPYWLLGQLFFSKRDHFIYPCDKTVALPLTG